MNKKYLIDLAERTVSTYAETFIGLLIASGIGISGADDMGILRKSAVAAIPAGLAVLKGALAKLRGNPDSASLTDTTSSPLSAGVDSGLVAGIVAGTPAVMQSIQAAVQSAIEAAKAQLPTPTADPSAPITEAKLEAALDDLRRQLQPIPEQPATEEAAP